MKGKIKKVKFNYFEVVSINEETKAEELYDLRLWISKIMNIDIEERIKNINGIEGRIESILLFDKRYYALNFMRLDSASDAYKVKENAKAEHIDLADDEYIGRNTVALYDSVKHIIMVQCNRGAYTAPGIQSYINETNENEECFFRPIISELDLQKCLKNPIRKIDVRCSNIRQFDPGKSATYERIIDTCSDLQAVTVHLEIGLGYERDASLSNETIYEDIKVLRKNAGCISSAKVTLIDDNKQSVYDLLSNLENDIIEFVVPERGELEFSFVAGKMHEKFLLRQE